MRILGFRPGLARKRACFTDKTIVISGAASGIGRELALHLSAYRPRLLLLDIKREALEAVARECAGCGAQVFATFCDVSSEKSVLAVRDQLPLEFRQIDIVVANAGITSFTEVEAFSVEQNARIMSVNYFGTVNLVAAFLPQMLQRKSGHIVGISSAAGIRGITKTACYGASKAAQAIFLEGLRLDLKPYNVKVTTILSGFVDTPMNDFLRDKFYLPFMLSPSDAANLIIKAILKNKKTYIMPLSARTAAFFGKLIPDWLYDFLVINQPFVKKERSDAMKGAA